MVHARHHFHRCTSPLGDHHIAVREWYQSDYGERPKHLPLLICLHGLTRLGADFEVLAESMSATHWVVAPDMVGRGDSDWLADDHDGAYYSIETYVRDVADLLRTLIRDGAPCAVDWLGTSMGGIIGLAYHHVRHTQPDSARDSWPALRRIIFNDIGVRIPQTALARISGYVGKITQWLNIDLALSHYRNQYLSFGLTAPEQWQKFTRDSIRWRTAQSGEGGAWHEHYDPRIAHNFVANSKEDINLSAYFALLNQPYLIVRGEQSDLLLADDFNLMLQHPNAQGVVFKGCGHAPALVHEEEIAVIKKFLLQD